MIEKNLLFDNYIGLMVLGTIFLNVGVALLTAILVILVLMCMHIYNINIHIFNIYFSL